MARRVVPIEITASTVILVVMSCISAAISLILDRKTRTLNELSQKINLNVFDKTFNVLNPHAPPRKTINSIMIWPIAIILLFTIFAMTISKIFEAGIALGFIILINSIGLMMVDEAIEINSTAKLFSNALATQTGFGKGDIVALNFLKQTMPKLKKYYILLAMLFIISAIMLPYILQVTLTAFTQTMGSVMATSSTLGIIAPYLSLLVFAAIVTIIAVTAGRIKTKAFGLGPSPTLTSIEEQFERITIMAKWGEAPPFELSHRPMLEDPEVEERKRRALDQEE
jgi:hypothetical protein